MIFPQLNPPTFKWKLANNITWKSTMLTMEVLAGFRFRWKFPTMIPTLNDGRLMKFILLRPLLKKIHKLLISPPLDPLPAPLTSKSLKEIPPLSLLSSIKMSLFLTTPLPLNSAMNSSNSHGLAPTQPLAH